MNFDFAPISSAMDQAFVSAKGLPYSELERMLAVTRDRLLDDWDGDIYAELQIRRCEGERLYLGAVNLSLAHDLCQSLFDSRMKLGFDCVVRRYLFVSSFIRYGLMNRKVPVAQIRTLMDSITPELRNCSEGCEESISQLEVLRGQIN